MDTSEYKGRELDVQQTVELFELCKSKNNLEFNMLKVIEESTEVNELLIKYITKRKDSRPSKEQITEELGDLMFRVGVLMKHLDIVDDVDDRACEKAVLIYEHLKNGDGTKAQIIRESE